LFFTAQVYKLGGEKSVKKKFWQLMHDRMAANWQTVTLVMPLAAPLIAVAWADYDVPRWILWSSYAVGIPVCALVVRLLLRSRRPDIVVAIALAFYCITLAATGWPTGGVWTTATPAVTTLSTAAVASWLTRVTPRA